MGESFWTLQKPIKFVLVKETETRWICYAEFAELRMQKIISLTLHGVMKNHLEKNSPVNPVIPNSAVALDAPGTLLTQVWGVDYQFK